MQDFVFVLESRDRCVGDGSCGCEIRLVSCGVEELGEAAENHALVVRPYCAVVVVALRVQTVVDEILGIDHAAALEPRPLLLCDLKIKILVD